MRKSAVRVACPLDEALTAAWTDWFWSTREPNFTFVLLEAAPHGDGGCLGGGDGNVQVDGMCNQYLIVLMMLFARQFDCMAGCCCVGLTKAVRDGREGDLGHR